MLLRMRDVEPREHPARGAARALRARPDQAGPGLLQGQPAEGRAGRRVRRRRRPAGPRRADLRARPADGAGLRRVRRRAGRGRHDVLLSSHILSEVERLADRVTIIREGRAVETGTLDELRHLRRSKVVAEVAGPVPDLAGHRRRARRTGRRRDGHLLGRPRGDDGRARRADRRRRPGPDQRAADAGGAVPRRLPERQPRDRRARDERLRRHRAAGRHGPAPRPAAGLGCGCCCWRRSSTPRRPRRPSLYPTEADRVAAAEAINASPAIVALYGPILDVHSTRRAGDDQDDGAVRRVRRAAVPRRRTPPHPHRGGVRPGGAARRHGDRPRRPAGRGRARAAAVALVLGVLAAVADIAGGLPVAGSVAFGASLGRHRPGRHRAHRAWPASSSASARTCAGLALARHRRPVRCCAPSGTPVPSWV